MADHIAPAPPVDDIAELAADLLERAVIADEADPAAGLDLLYRSASLGLRQSIALLGARLILLAESGFWPTRDENEARALEGLQWSHLAGEMGDKIAADFVCDTLAQLPDRLWDRCLAAPLPLSRRHARAAPPLGPVVPAVDTYRRGD